MFEEWFADTNNVCKLAHWLVDNGHITELKDLLYFMGKPWKWQDEWDEMQLAVNVGKTEEF